MELLELPEKFTRFIIGTLVLTTEVIGENPVGMPGVVYDNKYEGTSYFSSVILANGHDIGVFTEKEADDALDVIGLYPLEYRFVDPKTLMLDYKNGTFSEALHLAQNISLDMLA